MNQQDAEIWQKELDRIRPQPPTARLGVLDLCAPRSVVDHLVDFAAFEAGLGKVVARARC